METLEEVKAATKLFVDKTNVGIKQIRIANSLIAFKLSDDQLNQIDEIINQ